MISPRPLRGYAEDADSGQRETPGLDRWSRLAQRTGQTVTRFYGEVYAREDAGRIKHEYGCPTKLDTTCCGEVTRKENKLHGAKQATAEAEAH